MMLPMGVPMEEMKKTVKESINIHLPGVPVLFKKEYRGMLISCRAVGTGCRGPRRQHHMKDGQGGGCRKCRWTGYMATVQVYAGHAEEMETARNYLRVSSQLPDELLTGVIQLICSFYMPIPKSFSKKKRAAAIAKTFVPQVTPDTTNLLKFAEDVLTGLVYVDDKQVHMGVQRRYYGEEPGTWMVVKELDLNV